MINPVAQEMALVGFSSGLPFDNGTNFNPVTFQFDGATGGDFSSASYTVKLSDNFYSIDRPDANFSLRIVSVFNRVQLALLFDSPDELTISGTGVFLNYGTAIAGFGSPGEPTPAERFDQLEDGAVLFVNDGSGFDSGITVQIIPEPGTVVLGLLGIIPLLRRRRG